MGTGDGLASRPGVGGGVPILLGASCQWNRDKLRPFGPLARVRLYLCFPGKTTQQNEETRIGFSQMFSANDSSMNGAWNTYL